MPTLLETKLLNRVLLIGRDLTSRYHTRCLNHQAKVWRNMYVLLPGFLDQN